MYRLLWYNLFSSILVQMGFTLNPYDKCIANKMVNGKHMTIVLCGRLQGITRGYGRSDKSHK